MIEVVMTLGDRSYFVDVWIAPRSHEYYVTEGCVDASGGLAWERETGTFPRKRDAIRCATRTYAAYLKNTADL